MNNENNNNLNGNVLGSTDASQNGMPTNNNVETLETLDASPSSPSMGMDLNTTPNNPTPQNNTFFNGPVSGANPSSEALNNTPNPVPLENNGDTVNPVPLESTPAPEVAYTNPQNINPPNNNGMPGFESSSTIGTTPPISLEPEKVPEKKTNKLVFIIIVLVVLAGVGFGTYYVLNYTDLLNNKVAKVSIEPKNLEVAIGDKLSTNNDDYANITGTDSRNCSVDTTAVDVSKEGVYEYTITCGETHRTGTVKVVDNTELVVAVKSVYKSLNEPIEAKEFAADENTNLTFAFVDEEAVKNLLSGEAGTYIVKLKVTNANNKETEVDAELIILENAIKGFLTCSSNEQNITDYNAKMVVRERFAIADTQTNDYGNLAYEIHEFTFSDELEYNNVQKKYQDEGKITINNTTGDATFDDASKTVTITNRLDNDTIKNQYGADNLSKYSLIKSYFETNLGYICQYRLS